MPSELDATTDVVTLAEHADGLGEAVARRLEDHGIETVADILIAEEGALTDVPYVSELRADTLRELADGIVDVGPRDVDFDATESVVSETALPLSVRRGETVLAARLKPDRYHTTDCQHVRQDTNLVERSWRYVDSHDLEECSFCSGEWQPGIRGYPDEEPDPLVDSREVVLEATLGEKLNLTLAHRDGYARPWAVVETTEPIVREAPGSDTWQTRRIRISDSMSRRPDARECDLVVGADGVHIEDPPVKRVSHQPDVPSWRVESVGAVGRVSTSVYVQLQGCQEQTNAKPEGDDTWRKYHRGETA